MLLYIIYIEPLLMMMNRLTTGLSISSLVQQKDEDFCDDVNFLGEKLEDLVVIEKIYREFEDFSGAILSRSKKSKVMGLGIWKDKQVWPLQWLQVVPSIKIFGFQITPNYKQTLKLCWESCFSGFRKTVMSWSSRQLNTLLQRVEVLRVFATSKLWYMASALPLPSKFSKKFEALMGSFLWMGKLERLQLDEIKNPRLAGGLGLPCVLSKADALFLTQTCRLLISPGSKQYCHVRYWLGLHLGEYFPDMSAGPHAEVICQYLKHMRLLLVGGLVLGDVNVNRLSSVTAKGLYSEFTSTFPPPKVIYKYEVDWKLVWERLDLSVLEPLGREYLFMIIQNVVPNRERLFMKMNMVESPNCLVCGVREDNTHVFTECVLVREAWGWLRMRLLSLLPEECSKTSNFEFISLMFSKHFMEREAVWLLGVYVEFVWQHRILKKTSLKIEHLVGQTKYRYKFSRTPSLEYIFGIN